jgi:DEAD/DEAH box helicase domain-containing protein
LELDDAVRTSITERHARGPYRHQSIALASLLAGKDVLLATPTASGKTFVFTSYAAHVLRRDPAARVIALYPARALIADQLAVWSAALKGVGEEAGVIDGGVPVGSRAAVVKRCRVILMTPDVLHAWLLAHAAEPICRSLLDALRLLILDEAHAYEGAFGTQMAYLLRRLDAVSPSSQLLASTATVAEPGALIGNLTGRAATCIGTDVDGSEAPAKTVLLVRAGKPTPDVYAQAIRAVAKVTSGRFLAFGDSRMLVERVVACMHGSASRSDATSEADAFAVGGVLPYRAGYEEEDRANIQRALDAGELVGVVATSALELGIDIGAIENVILLGRPPSMKSFWQRFGRAGRRSTPGTCILVDAHGAIDDGDEALRRYLESPLEPSRLYLGNRYVQYTQALCAAHEVRARGDVRREAFQTLPAEFSTMLENELSPSAPVEPELFALKQRAHGGPHMEFPLRTAGDRELQLHNGHQRLGRLSMSQMLREAYPGAIHYYLGRAYRVVGVNVRRERIECRRDRGFRTTPMAQAMIFPDFREPLQLRVGAGYFVGEVSMQVSERVLGFRETRGQERVTHEYGPQSPWAQQPLQRYYETSGVCWFGPTATSLSVAELVRDAFCTMFGIQPQDVGAGAFHSKASPTDGTPCKGVCIYDATSGSLRLTELLATNFSAVLDRAAELASQRGDVDLARDVGDLSNSSRTWITRDTASLGEARPDGEHVVEVIAPGQKAMYFGGGEPEEVEIKDVRFTPHGVMYLVEPPTRAGKRMVALGAVKALNGLTRMTWWDLTEGREATAA